MDEASFGVLEDATADLPNPTALRQRMDDHGYLFIRGLLPRELILEARRALIGKLQEQGFLEPDTDPLDGILKEGVHPGFSELARDVPAVKRVVFGPEMKGFYQGLLGGDIAHFDYIWLRAMGIGPGTVPHCDIVYMGRGTHRLYTAWIPYGPVTYEVGGLMILEKSHLQAHRIRKYLETDVDAYCTNRPATLRQTKDVGMLSNNPVSLQEKMGGRWLTAEYQMGDLLTFRTDLVHASTDNTTRRVRLSTDTRYQRSDEPIDDRWIGDEPIGKTPEGKKWRIC